MDPILWTPFYLEVPVGTDPDRLNTTRSGPEFGWRISHVLGYCILLRYLCPTSVWTEIVPIFCPVSDPMRTDPLNLNFIWHRHNETSCSSVYLYMPPVPLSPLVHISNFTLNNNPSSTTPMTSSISDVPSANPTSSSISSVIFPEKKLDPPVHNNQKSINEGPVNSSKGVDPRSECVSRLLSFDQFSYYGTIPRGGSKDASLAMAALVRSSMLYSITACLMRSPQVRLRSAARCIPTILRKGFLRLRIGKAGIPPRAINLHLLWFCPVLRHRFCSSLDLNVQHRWPAHIGHFAGVSNVPSGPFTVTDSRRDAIYHDHPPASPGPRCQHRIYPPLSFCRCNSFSLAIYILVVLWV